ncbi:hypothetical protein C8F01DRAFT_1254964 [Mycena amicta]|nr:hypothetical protein C8F01DRAFT_1254964 [Mycena amicta]
MVSATEKVKLVYILNRDTTANLTILSPLKAHKANTIACFQRSPLEVDYCEADQDHTGQAAKYMEKMLTYYKLDLGLNHVVRKWSKPTDRRANLLVQVPEGQIPSSSVPPRT